MSKNKLFCSSNIYIESSLVGFRRNLKLKKNDNRLDFFVKDYSSSVLKKTLELSTNNDNKLNNFIFYYKQLDIDTLIELQKKLSPDLEIGFVDFNDDKIIVNRTISFNQFSKYGTSFDYIFLHQFATTKIEIAITSAISLLKEAISKNLKQELKVRDMKIFEEVFLIEGRKATYYGFLDNAKADIRQPIFEMETSLLIMIFEAFYKIFFDNYNQTTPDIVSLPKNK